MKKSIKLLSTLIIGLVLTRGSAYAQAVASFTASQTTLCLGDTLFFTNTSTGAIMYNWNFGNGNTSTAQNPIVIYPVAGSYTVTLIASDSILQDTAFVTITVNPIPTISVTGGTTICFGNSASLISTGATTYLWNTGATTSNIVVSPTTSTTYTVTGTTNGCSNSNTVSVIVNALPPTPTAGSNSPVVTGQSLSLTATYFTGATYNWTGPNGFSSTSQNDTLPSVTSAAAGVYSVTITDINGCTSTAGTTTVIINSAIAVSATSNNVLCFGGNSGSATATPTGGVLPYTYSWSPSAQTGATATGLVAGTYTVTVTDANSAIGTATVTITQPNAIAISTSGTATICSGASATITSSATGGTGSYTYLWSNSSSASSITVSPTSTTSYIVTITDINGCSNSDTASITVTPSTGIYGHVDSANVNSIVNGTVVLYKHITSLISFDTLQVVSLNTSGDYYFPNINYGMYLIKVFPNDTVYPTAMPTYFGNQFLWTAADSVNHGCNFIDTANISVQFIAALPLGPGALGGVIEEGVGFGRAEGDPIPGLDVKLGKNPGGASNIVASTQTDANGYYYFDNLALNSVIGGSYVILADIPGLGMASSYDITLDPSHTSYDSLNYAVDSSSIYTVPTSSTGISNAAVAKENKFKIYPNPFKGYTNIEYTLSGEANVTLEVYNVLGVKIKSMVNSKQSTGNHKCYLNDQLSSGVYFITLVVDGNESTQRIVVME
ncbi:MAG: hypothetical protein A3F72_11340 [Bacteroidetes bacterium RIFCSPLOWO2_12_FULL_35_15]|nr:MAG: hypothetical protein A3F72_11340 [Bacteroidetes bacterium RIFCSPLOWO2_12_FULL_35_15]